MVASIVQAGLALAVLIVCIAVAAYLTWRGFQKGEAEAQQEAAAQHRAPQGQAGGRRRLGRGLRQRRGRALDADSGSDDGGAGGWQQDDEDQQGPAQPMGSKEAKRKAYDERRAQKEAAREAAEQAALEELRRADDARRQKEEEEANKWMHLISTEGEGQDASGDQENAGSLLQEFISYIKESKMVALDELASEFRIPTSQVIERIAALEEDGTLTGIMDDRGKYIYISLDEMKGVAQYITQQGRVSIAELAAKSSRFIDLEAKQAQRVGGAAVELDLELSDEEQQQG